MSASVTAATEALKAQRDRLEEGCASRTRNLEQELGGASGGGGVGRRRPAAPKKFLSNMSHELRPVERCHRHDHALLDTRLDDAQQGIRHDCPGAASALLNVVGDILDFSKIGRAGFN